MENVEFNEPFMLVARLCQATGNAPLNKHEGLWEYKVDEQWTIKVNGHKHQIDMVPPVCCYVEYNGWPAGLFDPVSGMIAAGEAANEDTFCAALKAALERQENK